MRPSYQAEEEPEEMTSSSSEGSTASAMEGSAEEVTGTVSGSESSVMSEDGSKVEYNTDLGTSIPRDEGVLEPVAPKDVAKLDFGKIPKFKSRMGKDKVEK